MGGSICLCQGPLHFSPARWLFYYISSLAWKLRLFSASGSMPNWRKYMAALLPLHFSARRPEHRLQNCSALPAPGGSGTPWCSA